MNMNLPILQALKAPSKSLNASDPRKGRIRMVVMPMHSIEALMSLDGNFAWRVEGWPQGAKIVGAQVVETDLCLAIFHPSFPVLVGDEIPRIDVIMRKMG